MYVCDWVPVPCARNQHDIVSQLYVNERTKNKTEKQSPKPSESMNGLLWFGWSFSHRVLQAGGCEPAAPPAFLPAAPPPTPAAMSSSLRGTDHGQKCRVSAQEGSGAWALPPVRSEEPQSSSCPRGAVFRRRTGPTRDLTPGRPGCSLRFVLQWPQPGPTWSVVGMRGPQWPREPTHCMNSKRDNRAWTASGFREPGDPAGMEGLPPGGRLQPRQETCRSRW